MKYFDAILYILFTAVSFVFLERVIEHINPIVALSVMSFCGIIVFNLLNLSKNYITYKSCWHHKRIYLIMGVSLAIDWWTMVLACYFADPFVAMAALFIAVAFVGFFKMWLRQQKIGFLLSCALLIVASLLLNWLYHVPLHKSVLLGFILGAIAGGAFYTYVASSEKLANICNFTSMQILATRFWVLFISAIVSTIFIHNISLSLIDIIKLVVISFGSLIIPIYFNQQAISKLGADRTSIFISLVPPVTYLFYVIVYQELIYINVVVCLLITLAIFLPKIMIRNK